MICHLGPHTDELELDDYEVNFRRMFGDERMNAVLGSVDGSVRFFGLTPTSMKLEGLDRHHLRNGRSLAYHLLDLCVSKVIILEWILMVLSIPNVHHPY